MQFYLFKITLYFEHGEQPGQENLCRSIYPIFQRLFSQEQHKKLSHGADETLKGSSCELLGFQK